MHAIEFETQAHNGIVQIPEQYLAWKNKRVKVILLDSATKQTIKTIRFNAVKIKTKGYYFNRDEANENYHGRLFLELLLNCASSVVNSAKVLGNFSKSNNSACFFKPVAQLSNNPH